MTIKHLTMIVPGYVATLCLGLKSVASNTNSGKSILLQKDVGYALTYLLQGSSSVKQYSPMLILLLAI